MALYNKRLKIFICICLAFLLIIFVRLVRVQLYPSGVWKTQIEKLRGDPQKQLPTLRGKILDRNSNILAVDEARRLNHSYIGTEHLLLGLLREGEGVASGVLESLGVNLEKVRAETNRILSQSPTQAATASR